MNEPDIVSLTYYNSVIQTMKAEVDEQMNQRVDNLVMQQMPMFFVPPNVGIHNQYIIHTGTSSPGTITWTAVAPEDFYGMQYKDGATVKSIHGTIEARAEYIPDFNCLQVAANDWGNIQAEIVLNNLPPIFILTSNDNVTMFRNPTVTSPMYKDTVLLSYKPIPLLDSCEAVEAHYEKAETRVL